VKLQLKPIVMMDIKSHPKYTTSPKKMPMYR